MDEELDTLVFNVKSKRPVLASDEDATEIMEEESRTTRRNSIRRYTHQEIKVNLPKGAKYDEYAALYSHVAVHDYGENDDYNLDDATKIARQKYYAEFAKLRKAKRRYREIYKYVRACRQCYVCMKLVAYTNGVYPPDEFMQRVLDKKIHIVGVNFPKYVGKDRKKINWDFIQKYIENPSLDLREMMDELTGTVPDIDMDDIPDNPELNRIMENIRSEDDLVDVVFLSKKENKKFMKVFGDEAASAFEDAVKAKKSQDNRVGSMSQFGDHAYDTSSDIDKIMKLDKKRKIFHDDDIPDVTGPIQSLDDLDARIDAMDDFLYRHTTVVYNNKAVTPERRDEIKIKDAMENGGFNVRMLMDTRTDEERQRDKEKERDKKKEEELLRRLQEIDARKKARKKGKDIVEVDVKKSEKEEAAEKKRKKKEKKKAKKEKKAREAMDNITKDDEFDTADEYRKYMEDFTSF